MQLPRPAKPGYRVLIYVSYISQLDSMHAFKAPTVTTIEPGKTFYRAEDYHQDFLAKNQGYRTSSSTICRRSPI